MKTCGKCSYIHKDAVHRTNHYCIMDWMKPITRSTEACGDYSKRSNVRKIRVINRV